MPKISNTTTLTAKSQVTLPKQIRERLGVGPGDAVTFSMTGKTARVVSLPSQLRKNFGTVRPTHRPERFRHVRTAVERAIAKDVRKRSRS